MIIYQNTIKDCNLTISKSNLHGGYYRIGISQEYGAWLDTSIDKGFALNPDGDNGFDTFKKIFYKCIPFVTSDTFTDDDVLDYLLFMNAENTANKVSSVTNFLAVVLRGFKKEKRACNKKYSKSFKEIASITKELDISNEKQSELRRERYYITQTIREMRKEEK